MFIKNIPLPQKIDFKEIDKNKAEITIEPCFPGYGVTLGNALRRVLLSSLEGASVTAFKIKGVQHEFSTIPFVKEDLVEIILNLKKLRLKLFSDEPLKLELSAKGEKKVTAADISPNSQIEIINKNLGLATLTDKKANLDMEIFVNKGRGYVTVEAREKEKLEIGTIAIDTLYSPVVNVGFEIDNVRVGQITDYEKIIINLETDGSISPKDAFQEATKILVNQFSQILNPISDEAPKEEERGEEPISKPIITDLKEPTADLSAPLIKKKRGRPKKTA